MTCADPFMSHKAQIRIYAVTRNADGSLDETAFSTRPLMVISDQPKMTAAYWMPLNKTIMSTGADGIARIFDPESGEQQDEKQLHEKAISAVSFSKDKTM